MGGTLLPSVRLQRLADHSGPHWSTAETGAKMRLFVVFRNGGFCKASVFIASDIPDEGDAINHLTWPKRTLRVSTLFDRMVREYEGRRLDEMLQRYPYPPHQ